MRIETILTQMGTKKEKKTGAISYPVYFATAYEHPALGESTGYDYSRTANPTRDVLETAIAELENGDAGFACSSGMAAIHTVMGLFSKGDHLIVSLDLYGGTYRLFNDVMTQYGLSFTYVDLRDIDSVKKAIQKETQAIFVESPTNPLMRVTDIRQVVDVAKENDLITIVDNTFMTPYLQQPLLLGVDLVIHSATKYLAGHNDVLAGLIVTGNEQLSEKITYLHNSIGAVLSPMDAWLLIRGMKTLALRLEKQQDNAQKLVDYLNAHPQVEAVFYPTSTIQHKQASGSGAMLSFRLTTKEKIAPFLERLQLISFAESLGGVESLITYPATQTHADIPEEIRKQIGVCDCLLRFSVGIEHLEDLQNDIEQALK